MSWTETTRRQYGRSGLRYASDLTDGEWALLKPLMPPPSRIGRPRERDLRVVTNAILYMASTGCQWRQLPKDFSALLDCAGLFLRLVAQPAVASINHRLVMAAREARGPRGEPGGRRHR